MDNTHAAPANDNSPAIVSTGCRLCGSKEIHACTGTPIAWTDADHARFAAALAPYETD